MPAFFILTAATLVLATMIPQLNCGNSHLTLLSLSAAKSLQLCPTLCDPIDGSPLGSPIPGILQARTMEWVAISFSNVWKWKRKVKSLSRVRLLATPWSAAYQAPLSMGFSRQEYWSGVPLPSPNRNHSSYYWTVVVQYAKAVGNILFLNCVFLFNLLNNALSLPIF